MKNCALFFTITLSVFAGNISYAQNSILAGKIVDEKNKPIPGAIISVHRQEQLLQELKSDADGLYCSKLLDTGTYDLDIITTKHLKAEKIALDATSGSKKYYIIKLSGNKIVIDKTDEDPALKVKLGKIQKDKHNQIDGYFIGSFRIQNVKGDSATNNPKTIIAPGEKVPQIK